MCVHRLLIRVPKDAVADLATTSKSSYCDYPGQKKIETAERQWVQARAFSSMHAPVVWHAWLSQFFFFLARVILTVCGHNWPRFNGWVSSLSVSAILYQTYWQLCHLAVQAGVPYWKYHVLHASFFFSRHAVWDTVLCYNRLRCKRIVVCT